MTEVQDEDATVESLTVNPHSHEGRALLKERADAGWSIEAVTRLPDGKTVVYTMFRR